LNALDEESRVRREEDRWESRREDVEMLDLGERKVGKNLRRDGRALEGAKTGIERRSVYCSLVPED